MASTGSTTSRKRTRKPSVKATEAEFTGPTITVEEGECGDGCGQDVAKGRSFKQGHDAKLHSIMSKALKAGEQEAMFVTGSIATTKPIVQIYKDHNWSLPTFKAKAPKKAEAEVAA